MVNLKITQETGIDDIQTIVSDINELSKQFINPIDRLRSLSKPSSQGIYTRVPENQSVQKFVTKNNFNNLEINTNRPLESRTHCFYRMLGFPVMSPDGQFYNPGFEPNANLTIEKKEKINLFLLQDQALQNVMHLRENDVQTRRAIFVRQDLNSTAYALALRHIRSFSEYFDKNKGPLESDYQSFNIRDRIDELINFQGKTSSFEEQRHILRPFIVDPVISDTVTPAENLICVPFLKSYEDTKIDTGKALLRPGIEFICRLRLQQEDSKIDFLSEVKRILSGESASNSESSQDIRNAILAITGEDDLSRLQNNLAFENTVNKFTNTQISTITMLVKTIKAVVYELDQSIRQLDMIKPQINFEPIPSIEGPEFGGSIRTIGGGYGISEFEQRIGLLKVLDLNAQRQQRIIDERLGGGNNLFAISVVSNTQRNYNEEIAKLTRKRDELGNQALECMANIEKITGEVSGLGLIDILAIYCALWAIDLEVLIGFLDDNAFQRLYEFNPELRTREVESRKNGNKIGGLDVLSRFEAKLFNILSFVDKIFDQMRNSPLEVSGGDI